MGVTIGITTCNRKELLQIMAASLYESDLSIDHNIRIYDDGSMEYDVCDLKKIFPTAVSIIRNEVNLRADRNTYQMYCDFIKTPDEYFFNADSDILFEKDWLNKSMELIKRTKGVLSVFNANSHKVYKNLGGGGLVIKETIGAAGTLFTKERVIELLAYLDSIDKVKAFDWQFSEYFTSNYIPLFCTVESLVQHLGYKGQNSGYLFDFGRNYKIKTVRQGQIINDILESYIDIIREKEFERNKTDREKEKRENNFLYHLKRCLIIIIKSIIPLKVYKIIKMKLKNN